MNPNSMIPKTSRSRMGRTSADSIVLGQRVQDSRKRGVDLATQESNGGDDHSRDKRHHDSVLDGSRAVLVSKLGEVVLKLDVKSQHAFTPFQFISKDQGQASRTDWKSACVLSPSSWTVPAITAAIREARMAYSTAVAPCSSSMSSTTVRR